MKVAGSISLVTGANRGLGLAFAKALVEMGTAKHNHMPSGFGMIVADNWFSKP
jgi:hypothetical protein